MIDELVVADTTGASEVHGMHGGAEIARWKCLARRIGLAGAWEAIEWASLPPGAVCGEHCHTRTEELYFVISGEGELLLDDVPRKVRPGHLIANGLGTRHQFRNLGSDDLNWLVIEVFGPDTARTLTGTPDAAPAETGTPDPGESLMTNATVIDLEEHGEVDLTTLLTGPLRQARLATLAPGQAETLTADDREHTLFFLEGTGTARSGASLVDLADGTAITLPLGSTVTITAGAGALRYFHASLAVPAGQGDRR